MVRQRPRKSVEELYGTKFDNSPMKSHLTTNMNTAKTGRGEREINNYIISSTTPYNMGNGAAPPPSTCMTNRRKSARPAAKPDKYFGKDERMFNTEEMKKEHNAKSKATARPDKNMYTNANVNNANVYDNKNYSGYPESNHKDMHHNHYHNGHDDDKDDDTEEFFELIRQTVESAIGKSISDLLNRNFRELGAKVDRFSSELKTTNSLLNKLQTEVSNKVVHYGEENSRHFRYLCMKSEYDKMFYQHHTMLATTGQPGCSPSAEKQVGASKSNLVNCDKMSCACKCRPTGPKVSNIEPHKTSSDDHSISNKSSEMGMRGVLEQIQRFCTQMQLSDLKNDERVNKGNTTYRADDEIKLNKQVFDDDDDDFQLSSDGMTPRSDDNTIQTYGGATKRGSSKSRPHQGNGAGDA